MNDIVKNGIGFVKTNSRWLLLVVAWILVLWLDSKYPSISEFNDLKDKNDALTEQVLLFEQAYQLEKSSHEKEVASQKDRLNEKTDLLDQHTKDIVELKIYDARSDERLKHLKEQIK